MQNKYVQIPVFQEKIDEYYSEGSIKPTAQIMIINLLIEYN